jgi:hypothetical protein
MMIIRTSGKTWDGATICVINVGRHAMGVLQRREGCLANCLPWEATLFWTDVNLPRNRRNRKNHVSGAAEMENCNINFPRGKKKCWEPIFLILMRGNCEIEIIQ